MPGLADPDPKSAPSALARARASILTREAVPIPACREKAGADDDVDGGHQTRMEIFIVPVLNRTARQFRGMPHALWSQFSASQGKNGRVGYGARETMIFLEVWVVVNKVRSS